MRGSEQEGWLTMTFKNKEQNLWKNIYKYKVPFQSCLMDKCVKRHIKCHIYTTPVLKNVGKVG